jgi:hypothetical protein
MRLLTGLLSLAMVLGVSGAIVGCDYDDRDHDYDHHGRDVYIDRDHHGEHDWDRHDDRGDEHHDYDHRDRDWDRD